jgi:hypothetical protein
MWKYGLICGNIAQYLVSMTKYLYILTIATITALPGASHGMSRPTPHASEAMTLIPTTGLGIIEQTAPHSNFLPSTSHVTFLPSTLLCATETILPTGPRG